MLASIPLAPAISLLFGYSPDQFSFSSMSSFFAGIIPGLFLLFLSMKHSFTPPDSKLIPTGLLMLLAIALILRQKYFFLQRDYLQDNQNYNQKHDQRNYQ
jgi:hypothetical protein